MTATQAPTNPRRLLGFYYNEVFPRLDLNLVWSHLTLKGKRYEGHPCPKCGDTETYAYVGGWNLICGHTNSCGHRESVLQALSGAYRPDGQHLVDAIAQAAHLAGVPMPEEKVSPEERQAIRDWYARQEILEATVKWAHGQLMAEDESAADARDYLLGRGVDHAGIEKLSLGLVPLKGGPLALQGYLKSLVVAMPQAEKMGLLSQNFAGFILFPWRDEHGGMLTIAGRWPGDPPPKSIHPGTFNKNKGDFVPKIYNLWDQPMSAPLYLDRARRARCKVLVIVEGLFDAALAQVRGDARVIATGTSLVAEAMAEAIARQKPESVVLVPDGDEAGQKGVGSSVKNLSSRGVRVYVAPSFEPAEDGGKMDPARFIVERCTGNGVSNGLDPWTSHIDKMVSAPVYQAQIILQGVTQDSENKQRDDALGAILTLLRGLDNQTDSLDEPRIVKMTHQALGVTVKFIEDKLKKHRKQDAIDSPKPPPKGRSYQANGRAPRDSRPPDHIFELTDIGNGQRLVYYHGDDLRYSTEWGKWLVWDGMRWTVDRLAEVYRRAKDTQIRIFQEASLVKGGSKSDGQRESISEHAVKSASMRSIDNMIKAASSDLPIPIRPTELDSDPWLLNCKNGTVDLRTGELRGHDKKDLITKVCPVEYDPASGCPMWMKFLDRILAKSEDLIRFLARAVGYSITGRFTEKAIFIAFGTGDNGKSVFINTIREMLGDYGCQAAPDLLIAKNHEAHPTELADLMGTRFVASAETGEGKKMAESLVKALTGGDKIKARKMREDFVDFDPTFKLWLATNHKPKVRGTDHAIWERIKLIPFEVQIPKPEQDKTLTDNLKNEWPGILRWAVDGCLEWSKSGLGEPAKVTQATASYQSEMDALWPFIEERCKEDKNGKISIKDMYLAYKKWAEESNEHILGKQHFNRQLEGKVGATMDSGSGNVKVWKGIRLRREIETDEVTFEK